MRWALFGLGVLALGASGCARTEEGVLLRLVAGAPEVRPTFAVLAWYGPSGTVRSERIPETGFLTTRTGPELATAFAVLEGHPGAERKVVVRGLRGDRQVGVGAARVPGLLGHHQEIVVTLAPSLPDRDGDGLPDLVDDDCAPGCAPGPDGGAPDAPAKPLDGPLPPPLDARAPERPALPPDGATPVDAAPPDTSAPPAGLAEGLVGYWKFDEGPGHDTTADSASGQLGGALKGMPAGGSWTSGYRGSALSFTGAGWVKTAYAPILETIQTAVTISAWVYRSQDHTGLDTVLQRQVGTTTGETYSLHVSTNKLAAAGSALSYVVAPTVLPKDRWVHVAITYDGTGWALFTDGKRVAQGGMAGGRFAPQSTPLTLGAALNGSDPEASTERFYGKIDEVALWSRALRAEEIAALATGRTPK